MRSGHVMLLVVADVARGELGEGNSGANDSDRGGLCIARAVLSSGNCGKIRKQRSWPK